MILVYRSLFFTLLTQVKFPDRKFHTSIFFFQFFLFFINVLIKVNICKNQKLEKFEKLLKLTVIGIVSESEKSLLGLFIRIFFHTSRFREYFFLLYKKNRDFQFTEMIKLAIIKLKTKNYRIW